MANTNFLAAPCGLFCGVCSDFDAGVCHGCGCDCGACAGKAHADNCPISACAHAKASGSCANCADLPCSRIIQFTNDPIWRTHAPAIENLRRMKSLGKDRWVQEQQEYWRDEKYRNRWIAFHKECGATCAGK